MNTGEQTTPELHRQHWVGLVAIGAALVSAVVLLGLDGGRVALERETLIRQMVVACRADEPQTYLMYEACVEAKDQAEDVGLDLVELSPLEPEQIAPGDFVPE